MKQHLALLGLPVSDRVTERTGVVVNISFDISGCVQAYVTPKADKDGKVADGWWCDTKRLVATANQPLLAQPYFEDVPGGTQLPGFPSKSAPR